jgi:hypothetical protein
VPIFNPRYVAAQKSRSLFDVSLGKILALAQFSKPVADHHSQSPRGPWLKVILYEVILSALKKAGLPQAPIEASKFPVADLIPDSRMQEQHNPAISTSRTPP